MRNERSLTRNFRAPSAARQAGMSLIEIIIVIVLIGAVLTFVGSRVLGGADRAKANLAKSQVTTMAQKVQAFQMDTGRLPVTLEELVTAPGDGQPFDLVILGKDGEVGGSSVDSDIAYE